jgi:hypothetical protein
MIKRALEKLEQDKNIKSGMAIGEHKMDLNATNIELMLK